MHHDILCSQLKIRSMQLLLIYACHLIHKSHDMSWMSYMDIWNIKILKETYLQIVISKLDCASMSNTNVTRSCAQPPLYIRWQDCLRENTPLLFSGHILKGCPRNFCLAEQWSGLWTVLLKHSKAQSTALFVSYDGLWLYNLLFHSIKCVRLE